MGERKPVRLMSKNDTAVILVTEELLRWMVGKTYKLHGFNITDDPTAPYELDVEIINDEEQGG